MLLFKIAFGLWIVHELIKYYQLFISPSYWWIKVSKVVETVYQAALWVFAYAFIIDMATGLSQVWNGLLEIAGKIGAT